MITSIEIENFRCFEYTKIEGFSRVNLIGGKNNSGKTALLEAILLNQSPQPKTIFLLRQLRKESIEFSKVYPEKTWDSLFFRDSDHAIIMMNNQIVDFYKSISQEIDKIFTSQDGYNKQIDNIDSLQNFDLLSSSFYSRSKLSLTIYDFRLTDAIINIERYKEKKDRVHHEKYFLEIYSDIDGYFTYSPSLYKRSRKLIDFLQKSEIQFISSSFRLSSQKLAEEYSKTELNQKSKVLLNVLQIIDKNIQAVKTITIGKPNIYLQKENGDLLPISMFGDAINRVTEIILTLINNEIKTLLIDEIENGIHYTNHRDFWKALFELAKQLNVQIFATTHSLEMIQAFTDVGLNYYPEDGAYFEMTRHYDTDQIIGIKRDLDTLDYALKHGKGVRGE